MLSSEELFTKIKYETATWSDYTLFLNLNSEKLEPFLELAQAIKKKNFGNILKVYIPNLRFPVVSITGTHCALDCEHCNKKYLKGMKPILDNNVLEKYLDELDKKGGLGILLSGGSDSEGSVPLLNFLDTIKKVKNKTNLIINTHTGLPNEETVKKLAEAKVDIISFDLNMDEEIIHNIYHLNKTVKDYEKAVKLLKKYDLNIVPHICIGLYYGMLHKELEAIKFIKESGINPSLIVLIALIPPKKKKNKYKQPNAIDIAKLTSVIRFIFPNTEISLGCMRPRGNSKIEIEKYAIKAGITRIEIPSPTTLKWLKQLVPEVEFKFFSACCAVPEKYENLIVSNDKDIKRYLSI
jgi:uncharacterized radical SAM superfamily protein